MTAEERVRVADRLNQLDDELTAAERAGNVSAQIAALRERARCWREWAEYQEKDGQENAGASLAAQRDEHNALQLEGGAR